MADLVTIAPHYRLAGEKHKGTFLAPVGIGLSLFLGELLATKYTGEFCADEIQA